MTQEELDALMNGDIDMDVGFEEAEEAADVSVPDRKSVV